MFHAYVIQSLTDNSLYKGHCEDLNVRLQQHNRGETRSISSKAPFKLVYSESFPTREQAISREKYLKTAAGRRFLKGKLIP